MDTFARNRVLRKLDREANSVAALNSVDTIEPILSYDTAYNLQQAIARYQQIVANGGWEQMPREVYGLVAGNNRNTVSRLRNRLVASGDLAAEHGGREDMFDQNVDAALRYFQARHGLQVNGKVDEATFYALNVPADFRLGQLQLNLQRVDAMAPTLSERYVVVNIPAALIEAVGGGTVAERHTAVVGRIDRQTPILESEIREINFNPYWTVPKSIIRKDLITYMNEDPQYLTKYDIRIFDGQGQEVSPQSINWSTDEAVNYTFRQEPGAENSLGHVRINFPNPYAVYLHDTPTKSLFAENQRFHSSGCVRVENVDAFVAWILQDGQWDVSAVQSMFQSGAREDVPVSNPVPIHTTYITAWANRNGTVSFREDVYNYDQEGKVTFESA